MDPSNAEEAIREVATDLPADDPALNGIREKIARSSVPQHEHEPVVLDSLAKAMQQPGEWAVS